MAFFEKLLTEDGHWAGDYGGPMFLLCGLVIVCYLTDAPLEDAQQKEIVRYLRNNQCADGGWGLHIAGDGSVLCTSLNYVVVRILGVSANDEMCVRAREFLHAHGGALCSASWGKFWLSVLNVYDWNGMHPVQPELWLVPQVLPFHPSRIWCHSRQIYLPMSYVYAHRISAEENELVRQLRVELYDCDYESIDWIAARDKVAAIDAYAPHHWLLDYANLAMNFYEGYYWPWLRQKALEQVLDHVIAEDRNTKYIGIGPISKMINMLVMWHAKGSESSEFKGHYDRLRDYLWIGNDGMRMQGTNGSQVNKPRVTTNILALGHCFGSTSLSRGWRL
jgi:lanosterol synthase